MSKISVSTGTREKSNIVETVYEVPRRVIAETIINAVAHRDYYSKAGIQVSVFKDRIEISNPGSLPPELDIEDLKKHIVRIRIILCWPIVYFKPGLLNDTEQV